MAAQLGFESYLVSCGFLSTLLSSVALACFDPPLKELCILALGGHLQLFKCRLIRLTNPCKLVKQMAHLACLTHLAHQAFLSLFNNHQFAFLEVSCLQSQGVRVSGIYRRTLAKVSFSMGFGSYCQQK